VLNAALNFKQFWDGRADDLEQQAEGPIINPKEMAASWDDVLAFLQRDGEYSDLFRRAFADGVTKANVTAAIAEYERTLVTPDSPFDRSLKGDEGALSPMQKRGYERFVALGCISCHQGANVGGNTFQTMGKMEDYFAGREVREADLGRFNVTKNPADKFKFKVPSLRTAALTAPYFHDGSAETLEEAVDTMARYQLGLRLEEAETAEIVAFLQSLTGRGPTE
jgi:cytochrome c peroxidase